MGIFNRKPKDKTPAPKEFRDTRTYNYETDEARLATARWLFDNSANSRTVQEGKWLLYNDYYNFLHRVGEDVSEFVSETGLSIDVAMVPDAYIQIESQVDPILPSFEFNGREGDDSAKATQRQYVVRYIMDKNLATGAVSRVDRRLLKYGDAFYKVYYQENENAPLNERGDLYVDDIPVEQLYFDPTATDMQAGQYVNYVYQLYKLEFWRRYGHILREQGLTFDDFAARTYVEDADLLTQEVGVERHTDTIQVLEHWYKQPFDDPKGEFKSGDIALTVQAGEYELKYIPKYWEKTGRLLRLMLRMHMREQ